MKTFEQECSNVSKHLQDVNTTKSESARAAADQPSITYAEVMEAVSHAPELSNGVRQNIRGAVAKCAGLMSKAGLTQLVDIPKIAQRLDGLSPKHMGFEHRGSKSAFQSNLRRALRLDPVANRKGAGVRCCMEAHNSLDVNWSASHG